MESQRSEQTTLLFISHDFLIIRHLSDRVMEILLGHVIEFGTTEKEFSLPIFLIGKPGLRLFQLPIRALKSRALC